MKPVIVFVFFCRMILTAIPLDFYGRIQNTTVSQYDTLVSWKIRQQFSVNLEETRWNRFRLDADMGFRTELDNKVQQLLNGADRFQIYGLRLETDFVEDKALMLELGRLFLYEGLPMGAIDGFRISGNRKSHFDGSIYGGVESHYIYSPAIYRGSEGLIFGFKAGLQVPKESRAELSYLADVLSTKGQNPFVRHLAGVSFRTGGLPKSDIALRYVHDFIKKRAQQVSAGIWVVPIDKLQIRFKTETGRPEVLGKSYFERFEIKEHTLFTLGAEIQIIKSYGITLDYGLLTIENEQAQRLDLRVTDSRGSIGVIVERGSLGNTTGLVADYAIHFFDVWTLSVAIDYSQYRIQESYELDRALGNAIRIAYGINNLTAELEGRWLSDRTTFNSLQIMNRIRLAW
jgi:hypothetical protein